MENCACLTMNGVGEPCAGEPHARFDRGPLGRSSELDERHDGRESASPAPGTSRSIKPAAYLTGCRELRSSSFRDTESGASADGGASTKVWHRIALVSRPVPCPDPLASTAAGDWALPAKAEHDGQSGSREW